MSEKVVLKSFGYTDTAEIIGDLEALRCKQVALQKEWNSDVIGECRHLADLFFKKRITGMETLVEVGTGFGFFTDAMLQAFPRLTYFSYEPNPVLSRSLANAFERYRFQSLASSGYDLGQTPDDSVDIVVFYGVFTFLSYGNTIKYLQEVYRVLRDGGLVCFDIFDTDRPTKALLAMFENYSLNGDERPYLSTTFLCEFIKRYHLILIDSFQQDAQGDQYKSRKLLFRKNTGGRL